MQARLALGTSFYEQGDIEKSRDYWLEVKRDDDKGAYARARFSLGTSFYEQGDIEQACEYWLGIDRDDNREVYAQARFNLGSFFNEQGDIEQARDYWLEIKRDDDKGAYAQARLALGISFNKQGDIEQARKYWLEVKWEDNKERYAQARYNLGNSFYQQGDIEKACKYWFEVKCDDNKECYTRAMFALGISFYEQGNIEQAHQYWLKIERDGNKKAYAFARYNLGLSFYGQGDIEKTRKYWLDVEREGDKEVYARARFNLGVSYFLENKTDDAYKYFQTCIINQFQIQSDSYNNSVFFYQIQKIAYFLLKNKSNIAENDKIRLSMDKDFFFLLQNIAPYVDVIQQALYVSSSGYDNKNQLCFEFFKNNQENCLAKSEQEFAHYTRPEIAGLLMNNSNFQLGVANHMNDPTEGKILLTTYDLPQDYDNHVMAFLTSFTFNKNSLNQFRLYGKENDQDGSGVSLVLGEDFFDQKFNIRQKTNMNVSLSSSSSMTGVENLSKTETVSTNIPNKDKKTNMPTKLPLFRCIYMDPKTEYLNVAHRSKMSFYADNCITGHETEWTNYLDHMEEITIKVKTELNKIRDIIQQIKTIIEQPTLIGQDEIYEAIATTLLPIIYLIKHAAFEEEAECRLLYVTSIFDSVIKNDNGRIYVEYQTSITDQYDSQDKNSSYLKEIYLGPKVDPRVELKLKKNWVDTMRNKKNKSDQDIAIPTIKKSDMPLA